jgi:hypothetical protein
MIVSGAQLFDASTGATLWELSTSGFLSVIKAYEVLEDGEERTRLVRLFCSSL